VTTANHQLMIISRKEALRRAGGIARSTALRLEETDPTFPKPVVLSPRRIGYYEHEWDKWLASRERRVI
jgi:predicted DNA-binding transcriptional regulator AlpA